MKKMQNEIYPLGSIVKLRDQEKTLMIIGYIPIDIESKVSYDYLVCLYPEGVVESSNQIGINADQIEKVIYKAPKDEENTQVLKKLSDFYENKGKERLTNNLKK